MKAFIGIASAGNAKKHKPLLKNLGIKKTPVIQKGYDGIVTALLWQTIKILFRFAPLRFQTHWSESYHTNKYVVLQYLQFYWESLSVNYMPCNNYFWNKTL